MWMFVRMEERKFSEEEFEQVLRELKLMKIEYKCYCHCGFYAYLNTSNEIELRKERFEHGLKAFTVCHDIFKISEEFVRKYNINYVKVDTSFPIFSSKDERTTKRVTLSIRKRFEKKLKEVADYAMIRASLIGYSGYIDIYAELSAEKLSSLFEVIKSMFADPVLVAEVI